MMPLNLTLFFTLLAISIYVVRSESESDPGVAVDFDYREPRSPIDLWDGIQKRSLASGRWGLRPGKRSIINENDDMELENNRIRRSLASGRWGLRPGKRSLASGRWGLRPGKRSAEPAQDPVYLLIPSMY